MSAPFFSIQVSVGIPDSCEVVAFDRKQARFTVGRPLQFDEGARWEAKYEDMSNIACEIKNAIEFADRWLLGDGSTTLIDQVFFETFWLQKERLDCCLKSNATYLDPEELKAVIQAVSSAFVSGDMGDNDVNEEEVSGVVSRCVHELWAIRDRLDEQRRALGEQEEDAE